MFTVTVPIDEIANLITHRFYLSLFRDRRKKNSPIARMIEEIKYQESVLIRAYEEELRRELAEEIRKVRTLSPLERVALYAQGPRWMIALAMADMMQ